MVMDRGNVLCGAIFVAFGIYFGVTSLSIELGTAFRMGPGFFPLMLAGVLVLLGLVIVAQAIRVHGEPVGAIAWRGVFFILPAPVFFGLTVRGLGFVPAIFFAALIASFASARMPVATALVLSVCVTVFSALVFVQGLGLPFRLFGPWLGQ